MAKHDLTLLGALVALREIPFDDAKAIEAFCAHVDLNEIVPISLEAAIDLALEYFEPPADEAEAIENAPREHNHELCPDCGGPMEDEGPDEVDFSMAMDLWQAVRGIADKYAFDRCDFSDADDGREEC